MRRYAAIFLALLTIVLLTTCSTTSGATGGALSLEDARISALGAIGRMEAASLYEGNGGADIRLAVLAPETQGDVPGYLPVYVQGLLNNNLKRYSAITLIDRQNLDRIITEQDLGTNGRFSDQDFISIGDLTNTRYFLFGTIQKLSGERYSLQLSITDSNTGVRRANSMKDGTLAQLEGSGALINAASAELLAQMGVRLTDAGERALLMGNVSSAGAEAGFARALIAEAGGDSVQAMLYFSQAAAFDPSQLEALTRLNMLSSTISGGTISQRILNDIQARERWLEVFRETARFFNEHPPFEITFDPNLIQEGETDYGRRTANLAMQIALDPSDAGFGALNSLLEGLAKTDRRDPWGFSGWPLLDISPRTPGTVVFGGQRSFSFKVDAALVNENRKTIAARSITLKTETMRFSAGDTIVSPPFGDEGIIRFPNVKIDDLTDTLTIVINSVNLVATRNLNVTGNMKIAAGDLERRKIEKIHLVQIPGGSFQMGSPANEQGRGGDETQHRITISPFYMSKYEVTQRVYQKVMGTNPSRFKGDNLPVEQVSWYDAIEFCNKLSQQEGLTPAYTIDKNRSDPNNQNSDDTVKWTVTWNRNANGYRLPTEAEWEYACRAGTTTRYWSGNDETSLAGKANVADLTAKEKYPNWTIVNIRDGYADTSPVGSFAPNPWGLYDMSGNVWEWCWNWYGTYPSGAQTDPRGASSGSFRVFRGGSGASSAALVRSANRRNNTPSFPHYYLGFRLVRP
jgi:formylglycine-generating enzyme required for sulfatase activity